MKKETKRYIIVEYAGSKQRIYDTQEELDKVLGDIKKYNNRKKTKYICGNIDVKCISGKYHVNIHLYHKLSEKHTISEIDDFTKNFTKEELNSYYSLNSIMKDGYEPDINIAYFESKDSTDENNRPLQFGIKYIPVLYKEDLKYFDDNYIKDCLRYHAQNKDINFFKTMINEFCCCYVIGEEIEELYLTCDKVKFQGYDFMNLYYTAYVLYKKLIYEREKDGSLLRNETGSYQISQRRKRDFCFFLKNYNGRKRKSPLRYNGSVIKMMKDDLIKAREELVKKDNIRTLQLK